MSSALSSVSRRDVIAAISRIDREGVPPRRESTKFHLVVEGKRYPPKYVISLAVANATGRELRPDEFSGGPETNTALMSLGFTIVGPGVPEPTAARNGSVSRRRATASSVARFERPSSSTTAPSQTLVARVVVHGRPASSPRAAGDMLLEAFERWGVPGGSKFTITPGGFVVGDFPSRWTGGVSWDSARADLDSLVRVAKPLVQACVTRPVLSATKRRTRVLTIGVDLMSEAEHAELVAVIDCATGEIVRWTGKSYPTGAQEGQLVQVADLESHLLEIAGERVLVLGCHDLNMFSARARANQNPKGYRRRRCDAMMKATARFQPTIVLQHPHSTDTANIWRMPWACLVRGHPSVRAYASGIGYFRWKGKARSGISAVLVGTRSNTGVHDIVVKSRW